LITNKGYGIPKTVKEKQSTLRNNIEMEEIDQAKGNFSPSRKTQAQCASRQIDSAILEHKITQ
jgi:hypothetical protein